jgi:predicted alpha/beta superfamily hydrolase
MLPLLQTRAQRRCPHRAPSVTRGLWGCLVVAAVTVPFALRGHSNPPAPTACTATGDLDIQTFRSTIYHNTRKLRVLLPAGYRDPANASTRYPVLYLNDGQNLFDVCTSTFGPKEWQVDETTIRLIAQGKVQPLIIVGIDNAGRHETERLKQEPRDGSRPNEYLPWPDAYLDPPLPVVHGQQYPEFLAREVMPYVASHYRVKTGPDNTGLGGSSYGALITFYTVQHMPGVFGRVLIESPSLYVHDSAVLKEAVGRKDWPARLYFGAGTEETPGDSPLQVPGMVKKAVSTLEADGVSADRILVNITPGHHNEDAWAARFPAALAFLFPPSS